MAGGHLKLSESSAATIATVSHYLSNNAPLMRYDEYLEQGFPIATGAMEGACRYLIKDRMDITGARWNLGGAEAVLKLRSLRKSDDFDSYWNFHCDQRYQRNFGGLYPNNTPPKTSSIQ